MKMKVLIALLLAAPIFAQPPSTAVELEFGIGTRQTSGLGYEQRVYGDPIVYGGISHDVSESWNLSASISYIWTTKFFIPEGPDGHALALKLRLYYEPGTEGHSFMVGTRTTTLYTPDWDKERSGVDIGWFWRFGPPYNRKIGLIYHTPDEGDVWGISATYSWDQERMKWFPGMGLSLGYVDFPAPPGVLVERFDGYTVGIVLKVREKHI